jgi:sodium transport system permease protein
MRWSVVRLIAGREVRDQLRDRRTMFLILGLPVLMYPLFVGVGLLFVYALKDKQLVVGVVGAEHLPTATADISPVAGGPAGAANASRTFPPLLVDGKFPEKYLPTEDPEGGGALVVKLLPAADESQLTSRQVDVLVVVEPNLAARLEKGERPGIRVIGREGEENSKLAVRRVNAVLRNWSTEVKAARFARRGLPSDFDSPVHIQDPQSAKSTEKKMADELRDVLVKVIPFLLVMWMLTGSIYPAIDMTAGEKERGTMETLLISPAERAEIVVGKFVAVTLLGFGTSLWNVLLMLAAVSMIQAFFPYSLLSLGGLVASVLTALPLAMVFAACCLTLGVFARSTKEGNYYMVPIFFVVLPLAYWSMTPGIELDSMMSWVPVTNALLLQQRLMAVRTDPFPWEHVPAVAASLALCIGVALWAAIRQFQRESVLFREAEAGTKRGWSLFGKK